MRHFSPASILVILNLSMSSATAQSVSPPSSLAIREAPEMIVAAALRAQRERNWKQLLSLTHRVALKGFRQDIIQMMNLEPPHLRSGHVDQARHRLLVAAFGVESQDELMNVAPDSLLVRYLAYAFGGPAAGVQYPGSDSHNPRIVGHVLDGDSIAYVVVKGEPRVPPNGDIGTTLLPRSDVVGPEAVVDVVTLRRDTKGQWKTMLDGGLLYVRGSFALGIGQEQ